MSLTIDNFALRNVQHNERMSEETNCYSADLYLDGKKIAMVSNHGHGGCDMQYPVAPFTQADLQALNARIKAEMPGEPYEFNGEHHVLECDIEQVCGKLLADYLVRKEYQRTIKSKVLFVKPDSDAIWQVPMKMQGRVYPVERVAQAVLAKNPGARILNTMPEPEALALFRGQ